MPAGRKLAYPITLTGGRQIETVSHAMALIKGLPQARRDTDLWQTTVSWLKGAKTKDDMQHATAQLKRALDREGFLP